MEIIIAKNAGFCFGVKRAIKLAFDTAKDCGKDVYTLGPIIHNPQVVKKLAEEGVSAVESCSKIEKGVVILRSHGVTPDVIKDINKNENRIIDATCPFVKKAQRYATQLKEDGYQIIIVGDEKHPEVKSIIGYAGKGVIVTETGEGISELVRNKKVGIVSQTTQSRANLLKVIDESLKSAREVKILNTICDATSIRQEEAQEIAREVDLMLVVGGRNSANTTRLAAICKEELEKVYHIEVADEIDEEWFKGVDMVGITAGASTPDWIIEEIVHRLAVINERMEKNTIRRC
ncbi:MAG: 4-hydroxy-3-methylbut-2-enyl diphosphate reductase [Nitrospirae bacterium]|nr:4-hydroxy-3-methylbut-2-enyl diphosphate reductase [Nitrospirota bacterium]